jgi:hypothetical protein
MKHLTQNMIVHNSGSDLWDYLFENQKLRGRYEEDGTEDEAEFIMNSEIWMAENLLEGEEFVWFTRDDCNQDVIITNYSRVINMKKKEFRRCQYYSTNTMQCCIHDKQVNIFKWGNDNGLNMIPYSLLPDESKQHITIYVGKKKVI